MIMSNRLNRFGLIAATGLLAARLTGTAVAMSTCEGTYAAESLRPLPAKMVVDVDIRDPSPDHQRMSARFLEGLRAAGITVGQQPNVRLSITSARLDTGSDQFEDAAVKRSPDFAGMHGGVEVQMPAIPEAHIGRPPPPPSPPLLLIRVEATENQAQHGSWVANVQCHMVGTDDGAFAEDLGRLIGDTLGKRVERGPL
jgi:hypothetical protein